MKMTAAQLAGMPRRTPTEIADEAYQASRSTRRYPDLIGPAGVAIPDPRTGYRASSDPKLLAMIARKAFAAYRASIITPEREAELEGVLAEALAAAYPPSDMIVLRSYDLASVRGQVRVEMGRYGFHYVTLAEPMLLPNGKGGFHTGSGSGVALPDVALPFFDDLAAIEDAKNRDFLDAMSWPGQFKAREGRWPSWREIEAHWPRLAAWMASEREAAR